MSEEEIQKQQKLDILQKKIAELEAIRNKVGSLKTQLESARKTKAELEGLLKAAREKRAKRSNPGDDTSAGK